MLKKFLHHRKNGVGSECNKLCCTRIENFSVHAGNLTIFENVNIHIHCGELTAVIGPNGAGKSTLLKSILGLIPHGGKLNYVDAKGKHTGHPIIGYVPQYLTFDLSTPTSVLDLFIGCLSNFPVWLTPKAKWRQRVLKNLATVRAEHLIDRRLGALSGGELQRVLLALALEPMPDLLLLDEPVSGVDRNGTKMFYEMVSMLREKYDMAIILISHDLDLVAKYADKVVLLNKAVVCSGTPEAVFADEKTKEVFGMIVSKADRKGADN